MILFFNGVQGPTSNSQTLLIGENSGLIPKIHINPKYSLASMHDN